MLTLSKYEPFFYHSHNPLNGMMIIISAMVNLIDTSHETLGWEPLKVYLVVNVLRKP
jgi:hypothetical protein